MVSKNATVPSFLVDKGGNKMKQKYKTNTFRFRKIASRMLNRHTAKNLMLVFIGSFIAITCNSIHNKMSLMDSRSTMTRFYQLASLTRTIGIKHLRSCKWKMERLHDLISTGESPSNEEEISELVASIIIDGPNCNPHLLKCIESKSPLPNIYIFNQLRMADLNGPNIGAGLQDEQGLVLWMLSRINHDRLIPVLGMCNLCDSVTDTSARSYFVDQWRYELGIRKE
jgi:hypothetical protein